MNNEGYYEFAGHIDGGPSREAMFDSLRLGKIIDVQFVMTDREIVDRKAVVIDIRRSFPNLGETDDWEIELHFAGRRYPNAPDKGMKYVWKGRYTTRHRNGVLTSEIPVCLIRGQE